MIDISVTLKTLALASFLALGVAACQAPPVASTPANTDTATLQANTQAFARNTAIAAFYAQRCAGQGIGLAAGSTNAASEAFFARMTAAGYSRAQIETATATVDTAAAGQSAIAYLETRGLEPGAGDAALCTSASAEIAEGTAVGQLLTT